MTETVLGWGRVLQEAHGAAGSHANASRVKVQGRDPALQQLGAWTDAGTVYYRVANGTDMSDVLPRWMAALRGSGVPVQYLQLDDW